MTSARAAYTRTRRTPPPPPPAERLATHGIILRVVVGFGVLLVAVATIAYIIT